MSQRREYKTDKVAKQLDALEAFVAERGRGPSSFFELAAVVGLRSTGGAQSWLARMAKRGYVTVPYDPMAGADLISLRVTGRPAVVAEGAGRGGG